MNKMHFGAWPAGAAGRAVDRDGTGGGAQAGPRSDVRHRVRAAVAGPGAQPQY